MAIIGNILFVFFLFVGLVAAVLGLPGSIVVLLDVLVYGACTKFAHTPWWLFVLLVMLTVIAEFSDNILSAGAVKRRGGSNRAVIGSVIGGLAGVVLGGSMGTLLAAVGIVLGPPGVIACAVIGPLLGGAAGAFAGAYLAEVSASKSSPEAARAGAAAMVGRALAVLVKLGLVSVMIAVSLVVIYTK